MSGRRPAALPMRPRSVVQSSGRSAGERHLTTPPTHCSPAFGFAHARLAAPRGTSPAIAIRGGGCEGARGRDRALRLPVTRLRPRTFPHDERARWRRWGFPSRGRRSRRRAGSPRIPTAKSSSPGSAATSNRPIASAVSAKTGCLPRRQATRRRRRWRIWSTATTTALSAALRSWASTVYASFATVAPATAPSRTPSAWPPTTPAPASTN